MFPGFLAPSGDQPVDEQDDDRPDDGGDETRALVRPVPAEHVAEPAGDDRAANAEQDGDDAPLGVASGMIAFAIIPASAPMMIQAIQP